MFILASTSPRRKELFSLISKDFKIIAPNFDESKIDKSTNHLALIESKGKAYSIKNLVNPEDIIISCDTIVTLNGEVFGKPKNFEDAFLTLKKLSNNTHEVISGFTILYKDKEINKESVTKVTFNKLSDEQITNYINSENVYDKAGSYAIQDDKKFNIIKSIDGSFYNVMGFPLEDIKKELLALHLL